MKKAPTIRRSSLLAAIAACMVVTAACTSVPGLRPLSYASPGEARVFASPNRCPHEPVVAPEAAPVIAAILTGAASQLLSNFGTALSEGAKGGNLPSSVATLNLSLQPDAVPRCLLIIRGSFDPGAEPRKPTELGPLFELPQAAQTEPKERLDSFYLPNVYRVVRTWSGPLWPASGVPRQDRSAARLPSPTSGRLHGAGRSRSHRIACA